MQMVRDRKDVWWKDETEEWFERCTCLIRICRMVMIWLPSYLEDPLSMSSHYCVLECLSVVPGTFCPCSVPSFRLLNHANHAIANVMSITNAVVDSLDVSTLGSLESQSGGSSSLMSPSGGICWIRYASR